MSEKISIIIPVYNAEKTLDRCLNSVANQTYKDLEIILVNDGSKDESGKICDKWAQKDDRIKVIHKENGGVSSARNMGLETAQGEYVCFIDSDDYVECNYADVLIKETQKNQIDLLICGRKQYDNGKVTESNFQNSLIEIFSAISKKDVYSLFRGNMHSPFSKLFKKEIIIKNGIKFCEDIPYGEDTIFVYDYAMFCNKIMFNNSHIYNYDIDSSVASKKFYAEMDNYLDMVFKRKRCFLEKKLLIEDNIKDEIIAEISLYYFFNVLEHYVSHGYGYRKTIKRIIPAYENYKKYFKDKIRDLLRNRKDLAFVDFNIIKRYEIELSRGYMTLLYFHMFTIKKMKELVIKGVKRHVK